MIKKILLILCGAVLALSLVACSCANENDEHEGHNHSSTTTQPTGNKDNNDSSEPPLVEKHQNHYWTGLEIAKNDSATSSSLLKGYCYECGDSLTKEVITIISYEEWKMALSKEGLSSFTTFANGVYTDYDVNGSKSWKINEGVQTEEYFINVDGKTSQSYADNFTGLALSYNSFVYNQETRSYVNNIDENTWVELGFADGKLLFHATNHKDGDVVQRTQTLFMNYDSAKVEVPTYFFEYFGEIIKKESLEKSSIGESGAEKVSSFLTALSFDGAYEISYLANGQMGVYFYFENETTDPIFNSQYTSVSVVAYDGKITSVTVGNNTLELTY